MSARIPTPSAQSRLDLRNGARDHALHQRDEEQRAAKFPRGDYPPTLDAVCARLDAVEARLAAVERFLQPQVEHAEKYAGCR